MATAIAIILVGAMFAGVLWGLGQRFLELYAGDVGASDRAEKGTTPTAGDEDEDEELDDDRLLAFLGEGVDSIARQQRQEWIDERRDDGLSDGEILEELRNREPVVIL